MACFALGFTACSDDPNDAVTKHVYGPDEAPYLRSDASATIAYSAEFRKGHVAPKTIYLKDYAEQIQTKLKNQVRWYSTILTPPVAAGIRPQLLRVAMAGGTMPLAW